MGDVVGKVLFALAWFACTVVFCRLLLHDGRRAYTRTSDPKELTKARVAVWVAGVAASAAFAAVFASWPAS